MATAPLTELIDVNIKYAVATWWPAMVPAPQWNVGAGWVEFPSFHSKVTNMDEMEWKGNYVVDVEARLLSSLKTEGQDSYPYSGMVENHTSVAARMEEFFAELTTSDLERVSSLYTNSIEKVYDIRFLETYADLDEADMVLEHKWMLQLRLFQGYQ